MREMQEWKYIKCRQRDRHFEGFYQSKANHEIIVFVKGKSKDKKNQKIKIINSIQLCKFRKRQHLLFRFTTIINVITDNAKLRMVNTPISRDPSTSKKKRKLKSMSWK